MHPERWPNTVTHRTPELRIGAAAGAISFSLRPELGQRSPNTERFERRKGAFAQLWETRAG